MNRVDRAKREVRLVVEGSRVPEDPAHAGNALRWLLRMEPEADDALQIAALAHDVERAMGESRLRRAEFNDYDEFKDAHARKGAEILRTILVDSGVAPEIIEVACRLVRRHEVGGDPRSDLLRDADAISFFDVNLPLYFEREGWEETKRRACWSLRRMSPRARRSLGRISYESGILTRLVEEAVAESDRLSGRESH